MGKIRANSLKRAAVASSELPRNPVLAIGQLPRGPYPLRWFNLALSESEAKFPLLST